MDHKESIGKEFDNAKDKIIRELEQGKDIMIKRTPEGLKIQSLEFRRIDKNE